MYDVDEERKNVRNLIRIVASFVMWPAFSISLVMMFDLDEHLLHIAGLFPLGLAGLVFFLMADRLSHRWVHE